MREIKFRGKRLDNGEWVYGAYFCLHHNDERNHIHHFIIPDNVPIPKEKAIGEIQVEIIPETLGQYTGLKDRNGKEIYERDIVVMKDEPEDIGSVAWDSNDMDWVISMATAELKMGGYWSYELEVIGNIYDNLELLEGANQ